MIKSIPLGLLLCFSQLVVAAEYEGFTESEHEIDVAAPEIGVLDIVKVKEGDRVKTGQVLAVLDTDVLVAALAVAKAKKGASGRLTAARAIEKLRRDRLDRLLPLLAKGNAQQSEVSQTQIELESAVAETQAAREAMQISEMEYKQLEAQITRRTLRSPINGIVTVVHKEVAELVGGNDFKVITLVSTDPLQATINVPTTDALKLKTAQAVNVKFPQLDIPPAQGKITYISPITDASTDTVKVIVQMANPDGKLRIGVKCLVEANL
ncbi:efflux RND transporter periplasmic adaptor subunit [Beggiatoa leptomitoformis]|uniref:Efflux RND transporter periplasmic adaptor subunit n=1 Tax=Beggiatoa leptomitoformis TaxID=288004 RepID=A0A2N9YHE1_9GAMM|nr:efflux RND transporter periplasmic adaptor subunit [Beggiatoa leptomitoformis]ALG67911.1 efflux RND transporter periplasmic adaptor subunit [Beggiatoa leptomitoformis]AUI69819.1 efflux RND transporter periplasmic adaptor subunit [Beggiatoa leptomitoformis]